MNLKPLFLVALLLLTGTACAASTITLSFQDVSGLLTQDIRVFDDNGTLIETTNSTGTATLDYNASTFYILQIQPQGANTAPDTMLTSFFAFASQYWYYLALLLVVIILIKR